MKQANIKLPCLLPKGRKRPTLPPITGELAIPHQMTVSQLASLLSQESSQIIADVERLGLFVAAEDSLSFEIIADVTRKYGFKAKRVA
jgi:Translation initiation factor IF-2, N-terminal region